MPAKAAGQPTSMPDVRPLSLASQLLQGCEVVADKRHRLMALMMTTRQLRPSRVSASTATLRYGQPLPCKVRGTGLARSSR